METLTPDATALLARVAAGLNGGRFAHLVSDETVKAEAQALVIPARDKRRRLNAQKRYAAVQSVKARNAAWLAEWRDYSEEETSRIELLFDAWKDAPKRSLVRAIAKRLFRGDDAIPHTDATACSCVDCLDMSDWRTTVKRYATARKASAILGDFAISRNDMSTSSDSRFFRHVVKHWHHYAGGKHVALHGVTPDDVLQDAFLSALEAGNVTGNVPTFGPMFLHSRQAVESAVYTYRRGHSHSESFSQWSWADWQAWAADNSGPRLAYSSDSNILAEWQAYDAARKAHEAIERHDAGLKAYREERMAGLDDARQALASLVLSGMSVTRVANVIGRTVDAIANGLDASSLPTVSYLSPAPFLPMVDGVEVDNSRPVSIRRYQTAPRYAVKASVVSQGMSA